MGRITISIPDDLTEAVDKLIGEGAEYRKRSHFFVDALKEYIRINYPELLPKENRSGPMVLEGIRAGKGPRGPSPRLKERRKLEGFRIE